VNASSTLLSQVTNLTGGTVGNFWTLGSDFLVVILLFVLIFLIAWWAGKAFIISFLLSLYTGYAIYSVFLKASFLSYLPQSSPFITLGEMVGVFFVLCLIAFFIIHKALVPDFISIGFFGLLILSFLATGFLLALAFHSFPVVPLYSFTPEVSSIFAPDEYFFWWFAAPLAGLFFFVR
jgi:hypothetical protein